MRQSKQSILIHVWEEIEFYLNVPRNFLGTNKPFVYFYYNDKNCDKPTRIRRYVSKCNGDLKKIKVQAKAIILELVELLNGNWNPVTSMYNELIINPLSSIGTCVEYWLEARERAFNNQTISAKKLKGDKILMMHLKDFLSKRNLLNAKVSSINNIQVKDFLDTKTFERNWGKVSYNSYRVDTGTFFNYLVDLTIIKDNPVKKVPKKSTKYDSSRFKVFELDELQSVSELLQSDKAFLGLHTASKILFKYNIRPLEITRIQVKDINWEKSLLTLPPHKTKNGNEAMFLLDNDIIVLLKVLIRDCGSDYYIFCKHNRPSPIQTFDDYFGQRWRAFRKKYELSSHLKFYALKHSSNYYDIENGASYEEIRQRNRHSNLQVTTLYIKERLFKNVIKSSSSTQF